MHASLRTIALLAALAGGVSAQMELTCEPDDITLFTAGPAGKIRVKTTPLTEGVKITPLGYNPGCIGVAPAFVNTDENGEAEFTVSCNGVVCHTEITFSGTNPWMSCTADVWCEDPCAKEAGTGTARPRRPSVGQRPRGAQSGLELAPDVPERIRSVRPMVYDLEERRVVRQGAPAKRGIATFCYVNTDTVGFFLAPTEGTQAIDWGILGGTATTQCCGLSTIVTSFQFAYATTTQDTSVGGPGASLTLSFYTGYRGFGSDSGDCPVASFAFTGLPGHSGSSTGAGSAYAFSVDVSGGGEFCMPDGAFGYGYAGDGNTGPLLCLTGDGNGGPEPSTGNVDAYDLWIPDTKGIFAGSFFFGGPPYNFASWYGQIARADLSASPATLSLRNGGGTNKPNSMLCQGGVLGSVLQMTMLGHPGYVAGFFLAFDSPISFTLGGGQVLLCIDLSGSGELLTGSGLAGTFDGLVGSCPSWSATVPIPKNVDFCGFSLCVQGLTAFGVTPFGLTSACDVTLGG